MQLQCCVHTEISRTQGPGMPPPHVRPHDLTRPHHHSTSDWGSRRPVEWSHSRIASHGIAYAHDKHRDRKLMWNFLSGLSASTTHHCLYICSCSSVIFLVYACSMILVVYCWYYLWLVGISISTARVIRSPCSYHVFSWWKNMYFGTILLLLDKYLIMD